MYRMYGNRKTEEVKTQNSCLAACCEQSELVDKTRKKMLCEYS